LFRSIEKWGPTIFVDEADTMLVNNEPLRAVINSGWTRGSGVLRDKAPHLFPTFCPKVIGLKSPFQIFFKGYKAFSASAGWRQVSRTREHCG
jgi:hypothetical protein